MRKNIFLLLFLILCFSLSTKIVLGATAMGGKITNMKATEISTLEDSGWKCNVPGQTITIKPMSKTPTTYLIPSSVESKTKYAIRTGQYILGNYTGMTPIICWRMCGYVPCFTSTVLNTISLFGTSK